MSRTIRQAVPEWAYNLYSGVCIRFPQLWVMEVFCKPHFYPGHVHFAICITNLGNELRRWTSFVAQGRARGVF